MRFSMILVSTVVLGGALGGCSGSTTNGTSSGPIPESQFASKFASTVCDNMGSCCQKSGFAYDPAKCKTALSAEISQILAMKDISYDAQAAGSCLDAGKAAMLSCNGFDQAATQACNKVFTGKATAGQPCQDDLECAPVAGAQVYCENSSGSGGATGGGTGSCVVHARGKKGDGCDNTCTGSASSNSCFSFSGGVGGAGGAGGASSTGTADCYTNDGLYCAGNGTCSPLIAIGQPCPDYTGCVDGAYCDNNGKCAATLAAGSPCSSFDACKTGEYCTMGNGPSGTCATLKANGTACATSEECQSANCVSGKCQPDTASTGISADMCAGNLSGGGGSGGSATGMGGMGGGPTGTAGSSSGMGGAGGADAGAG